MTSTNSAPWVIVAAGVTDSGGMEKANAALARYLLGRGNQVHLVTLAVAPDIRDNPLATVHLIKRIAGSFLLSEPLLDRVGRKVAAKLVTANPATRVVVNGGNCRWDDISWIHAVHAAWDCADRGAPLWFKAKNRAAKFLARRGERRVVPRSRLVIANSEKTRRDIVQHLGVPESRVESVYLSAGSDFRVATAADRAASRAALHLDADSPVIVFVGAMGYDQNKGIDVLLRAWKILSEKPTWDAQLVAAGGGRGMGRWVNEARRLGIERSIHFVGYTKALPDIFAASDLLVSVSRYEAYGLAVHEAVCSGVPAMISASSGIAERFGPELADYVIGDPDNPEELATALLRWRDQLGNSVDPFAELRARLLEWSWNDMAGEIVRLADGQAAFSDTHRNSSSLQGEKSR